jgi:copper homeostasis protein
MGGQIMLEICVGDVESAIAAERGGAHRIELCDNLAVGGTTPSAGAIALACRSLSIPVHVLIRPRGGDFVYSDRELAAMRHDISVAQALGAKGVVLGTLTPAGTVDRDRTGELVKLASPLSVTFHKAIDETTDLEESLETLSTLGVARVLTSGGKATALEGAETLARLVKRAGNRSTIMAGGALGADDLERVIRQSGVREVHLGSAVSRGVEPSQAVPSQNRLGSGWNRIDEKRVALFRKLVQDLVLDG